MDTNQIREYVKHFFTLRECPILEQQPAYMTVELNAETDKDLGYRPFYWSYIENAKLQPQLLVKRFIFDPKYPKQEMGDEYLYFGAQRLQQIFSTTKKRGQFVRLYEELLSHVTTTALIPWIMLNFKIEYICDKKKEELLSFGFNLVTGDIREQFFECIVHLRLTPKLPDFMFTQPPMYSVSFAIQRLENIIQEMVSNEDKRWADEAWQKFAQEEQRLQQYFTELRSKPMKKDHQQHKEEIIRQLNDEHKKRMEEVAWQYKPRIQISLVNAGVFFLHTKF